LRHRLLVGELELRIPYKHPARLVSVLARTVNVSPLAIRLAIEIVNGTISLGGRHPIGIAAGALHIACSIEREFNRDSENIRIRAEKKFAEAAHVSEATVRHARHFLL
jgi:transcription initiation factor TFIIIB Brf1 subunit/transcription initiation factor TFIIB